MADTGDEASFTFSWLALKLLGRGLYSNPWSALSELVANGLDAAASNVYVYIDVRNKSSAVVEVIDDGTGMSRADIDTYVKVGHNKRQDPRYARQALLPKGRKGIGKLAALFLSKRFFLETRHAEGESSWELDARDGNVQDDENPRLLAVTGVPSTPNDQLWDELQSGTRLVLTEVDLTGYGPQSINALGSRLANQFLLPVGGTPGIRLWVRPGETAEPAYVDVQKSVAFHNLVEVVQSFPEPGIQPAELAADPPELGIPAKGLAGGEHRRIAAFSSFPTKTPEDEAWASIEHYVDRDLSEYRGIRYELTGWLGVHATIESEAAKKNDSRFVKNRYYNPAQIRVYVRGKLASDHLLSQLGLTGTYANYIEGEISFDLLDDDDLPDIATSNRQDFDETDPRVTLLKALVRPLVRGLMQRRGAIAKQINEQVRAEKDRRETLSKRNFSEQVRMDLAHYPEISPEVRDDLQTVITNKIQGDVLPKEKYRVFISHSSGDQAFASFIDEVLRTRGARPDEIFYTSRTGSIEQNLDVRALGQVIKENITDANTLIFYMTSRNFLRSQFCLFEGGAGWATRGVSEYLKLNMDFESIPTFLTNGRAEMSVIAPDGTIDLTLELNNYIIQGILNPMIAHLNRGRDISAEPRIAAFELQALPSAVELRRMGRNPRDYREAVLVEHWETIVDPAVDGYLRNYQSSN